MESDRNISIGGSVVFMTEGSIFEVYDSNFTDNTSNGSGGCINALNSNLKIENSKFDNNMARGHGGSLSHTMTKFIDVSIDMKYFECINCIFQNSTSFKNGGKYFKLI